MYKLCRVHDLITYTLFVVGAAAIGSIAAIYCYEVAARYLFSAPTTWAYDVGSFALAIGVFLVIPQITRDGGHVAVTFLFEFFSPATAVWMARAGAAVAVIACSIAAWITLQETMRQMAQSVRTTTVTSIPAWWISIFMPYAFANTALYFLRLFNRPPPTDSQGQT